MLTDEMVVSIRLSRLEGTTWMTYVRLLLAGGLRIAELLEDVKAAVVVHCSGILGYLSSKTCAHYCRFQ
jgi:hypothetical protein